MSSCSLPKGAKWKLKEPKRRALALPARPLMLLLPSNDAVNHTRSLDTTTGLQVEVVAGLTLKLIPAKARAQGNGVRASLSYLLGGGDVSVRCLRRCTIPSVLFYRRSLSLRYPASISFAFLSVVVHNPLHHRFL